MVVHVVLFRPKADRRAGADEDLADSMMQAAAAIPSVRNVRVGQRVLTGRPYELLMSEAYTHLALIEFDDRVGLRTYLDHPDHVTLAERFFEAVEVALVYDYETTTDPRSLLDESSSAKG